MDNSISSGVKALYSELQVHKPSSIRELSRATKRGRNQVENAFRVLEQADWVISRRIGCQRVIIPTMPPHVQRRNLELIRNRDSASLRTGEYKMYLRFVQMIDAGPYWRNARPWFLQNPSTGEFLEYDIYAPDSRLAGEFMGRQHFEVTSNYPDPEALKKLQARDATKARLSEKNGITLIRIEADDLTFENMLSIIPKTVSLRLVDTDGIYARGLEEMCLRYIAYCRRGQARDGRKARTIN